MSNLVFRVVAVVAGFTINLIVLTSRYDYQCGRCRATFSLTPGAAAIAPHRFGGVKHVKCPTCGDRSWITPVPKA
jgi:DNA-directed RNA polymerase subunit RPC12/RpoP